MEQEKKAEPVKKGRKTFLQTLQDHHYGHSADEATDRLAECLDASEKTGKATELTIKVKIRPVGKQGGGRYDVTVESSNKLPSKEVEAAIMFVGPDGNLTNKDPRQQELEGMRVVGNTDQRRVEEPTAATVRVS